MKKLIVLVLALLLLAVPVLANTPLVQDGEGLLSYAEAAQLEEIYADFAAENGFTPILVTVDSFAGQTAEDFAGMVYDKMGYPDDGILYLVSLGEGQWYLLTNGECYYRISNGDSEQIGEILVQYLRAGAYYDAFALFPELAREAFYDSVPGESAVAGQKNYGKTILISMAVGLAIGGIVVAVMALQMKSVKQQAGAGDYVRRGSMHLRDRRDIFLYSHVSRTAKPKSNSSGGSSGGSRGGAGGRI